MEPSAIHKSIVRGIAWEGITKSLVQGLSWVSTIFVARLLHPVDYGVFAVASSFLIMMELVVEMGLADGLIYRSNSTVEEEDAVFSISLAVCGAIYVSLFIASPYIAVLYNMPALRDIIPIIALSPFFSSVRLVPYARVLRQMDYRYRSLVEMGASTVGVVVAITMALLGFGVWSLVYAYLARQAILTAGYLPILGRVPRLAVRVSAAIETVRYGIKMMSSRLLHFFYGQSPIMIGGKFVDAGALGAFSIANTLASIPLDKVGTAFNAVLFPALSRLKNQPEESRKVFLQMHRYLLTLAWPVLVLLILVANDLVDLLLTRKWITIAPIIKILCVASILKVSSMLISPALMSRNKAGRVLRYNVFSALVIPIAVLLGAPYGVLGIAGGLAIAQVPLYVYIVVAGLKEMEVTWRSFFATCLPATIVTILISISVIGAEQLLGNVQPAIRLVAVVGTAAVVYVGTFLLFFKEHVAQAKAMLASLRSGR